MNPIKLYGGIGNSFMVCANRLEFRPVGLLSAVVFPGPSEAVVDPQESGNSGQILFSAVFLKLSPSPWFISGAVLQKHGSLDKL